jgi:hypothetical protein
VVDRPGDVRDVTPLPQSRKIFIFSQRYRKFFLRSVTTKVPRSIKTVSFTIRKRGIYGSILYIYGSFLVRIKSNYQAQKYVPYCIRIINEPYLFVFTYFTDTIRLIVLQRIVTVNGQCLQCKLSERRHELVIHRLALL